MGLFKLGPNQREGGEVVGMQAMVKQGTVDWYHVNKIERVTASSCP